MKQHTLLSIQFNYYTATKLMQNWFKNKHKTTLSLIVIPIQSTNNLVVQTNMRYYDLGTFTKSGRT